MSIAFEGSAIIVRNIPASRHFYESLLQQEVAFSVGESYVAYKGKFSIWQERSASALMHERSRFLATTDPEAMEQFELYFETADLDAAWNELKKQQVPAVHAIREQPWGQRCFRVKDPDGYVVELAEPMPVVVQRCLDSGMTVEETAARTMLPADMIVAMKG
ncbi:MAG: VOC family protein [Halodesulfovibrio sp.]